MIRCLLGVPVLYHSIPRTVMHYSPNGVTQRVTPFGKSGKARKKMWPTPAAQRKAQQPLDNDTAGRKFADHV